MQLSDYLFLLLSADNVINLECYYHELVSVVVVVLTVFSIPVQWISVYLISLYCITVYLVM